MRKIQQLLGVTVMAVVTGCASASQPAVIDAPTPQRPAVATFAQVSEPAPPTPEAQGAAPGALQGSTLSITWWEKGGMLRLIDLKTGKAVAGREPISMGMFADRALSPDGKTLAAYVYPDNMNPASGALHLIDLQSWKDTELPISFENWVAQMAFSPDGRSLAITYAGPTTPEHGMPRTYFLSVIDLSKQAIAGTADLGFTPRTLNISADGRWLAVYGARQDPATALTDGFPRLVLLDARDLSVAWEAPLNSVLDGQYRVASEDHPYISWSPAVVLSADGSKLYVVHADQDSLTTVDLAARTVTTVKIGPRLSLLNQLMGFGAGVAHAKGSDGTTKQAVLSPDGAQLFVTGQVTRLVQHTDGLQMDETPLGLQVVEAATGVELQRVETKATQVAIAPDGSQLYLIGQAQLGWPWTDVLDTQSLEAVGHLNGWRVTPARLPDGRLILLANADPTTTVSVIDGATLKEMNRWVDSGWVEWIVKP